MATLLELDGVAPVIGEDVYLAPNAVLVGDVHVGARASIWFGVVLRGDSSGIDIGPETSVQDNTVVHCAHDLRTVIGSRVTVGHGSLLEGCVIEDDALIGMGSIVLQRARVERGAMLAAGTVVPERATVPAGVLYAGVPGTERKQLSGAALAWTQMAADEYQKYRHRYLTTSRMCDVPAAS